MPRPTNHRQLLRILKGEDLEFRITSYSIRASEYMVFEDLVFPYDLNFKESSFGQLIFKNCRFYGKLILKESSVNQLSFEGCEIKDIEIEKSQIKQLHLSRSERVRKFHIGTSSINELTILDNLVFEAIEVACETNIMVAQIEGNGNSTRNSFKSTIYICPERFDKMILKNNTSEILHIGTIGQYSSFEIENCNANLVLFSNCNSVNSKVRFRNLKPIDPLSASVCIVNSETIVEMRQAGVFDGFRNVKRYSQEIHDLEWFRGMVG